MVDPYGEVVEAWVVIESIPPKWCTWRFFAPISPFFGILTDVDWHEMFKGFFAQVRIKLLAGTP